MCILVDEDTAVQLIDPLRHVLPRHEVTHVSGISWKGKKDRQVLPDARKAGYDALITRDRAQLSDPRECDAIRKSGLHHIRYTQRLSGVRGLALALGSRIAAMPMVMQELTDATTPSIPSARHHRPTGPADVQAAANIRARLRSTCRP
jgi:PIN like domain